MKEYKTSIQKIFMSTEEANHIATRMVSRFCPFEHTHTLNGGDYPDMQHNVYIAHKWLKKVLTGKEAT
ncbi:MAG: hypothetical protein SVM79_00110 [Chloroflexota bacterium]|nr:hypothetical protein [Chloroflexota bacterium]